MPATSTETKKATHVLIVDVHALVRAGVRALLEKIDGVKVVAETGDGHEVISLTGQHQPGIILLDMTLPGVNALDLIGKLAQTFPNVKVIIVSPDDSEEHAAKAFRAGAVGYLPKSASAAELVRAVSAVRKGEGYSPAKAPSRIIVKEPVPLADKSNPLLELTPRQHQVLKLIAEGYSTREIARALEISVKTVESHRTHLMERLNIHDVASLVRHAIRVGVVKIDGYDAAAHRRE